jgi:hypothetical protein
MKYLNGMQTVKSMRSSGYRSTDYALAELIDNSIQAEAPDVIVGVVEKVSLAGRRKTSKAHEIWVLDNGSGMTPVRAEEAVSFGGSDRYGDRSGMGRFGMGLPQASVSQCKRTDLWTWQHSDPRDAVSVRIDLDEIEGGVDEVPPALHPRDIGYVPLPAWVQNLYENYMARKVVTGHEATPSGTAIRWSDLDRVQWVKGKTIINHVEFLLGRIYRRFLTGEAINARTGKPMTVRLQFTVLDAEELAQELATPNLRSIRPNDPLHLSVPKDDVLEFFERGNPDYAPKASKEQNVDESGNPIPRLLRVDDRAPFKEHLPPRIFTLQDATGKSHEVMVRTSRVSDEGRPTTVDDPGKSTHQGPHFARNRGVSIIRADREVCMDETYYYEATDRWWSAEVSFPPALDEVFGVTNNKQDVPHFKELCREILRRGEGESEMMSLIDRGDIDDQHGFAQLEKVATHVLTQVRAMRNENKGDNKARRDNARRRVSKSSFAPVHTTIRVKRELSQIQPTPGEKVAQADAAKPPEEQQRAREGRALDFRERAIEHGVPEEDAIAIGNNYMKGLTYQIVEVIQDQAPAFFWPDEYGDLQVVYMNTAHPAHSELLEVLRLEDEKISALNEEEAKALLGRAAEALGWLIHGWVRMEDNHRGTPSDEGVRNARVQWGQQLRAMLTSRSYQADSAGAGALLGQDEDGE